MNITTTPALLGTQIRTTRRVQKLTQEQLAAQSGVGIRFLRELEAGKESCQIGKVFQVLAMLGLEMRVGSRSGFSTGNE